MLDKVAYYKNLIYKNAASKASKPSYKKTDVEKLDPNDTNEVWTAKIDGAHTIIKMEPDKLPRHFSHRISKKTNELIEYTPKLPHIQNQSPFNAVVRGETYAVDKDGKAVHPDVITSLLNSKVDKSLKLQDKLGIKTKTALIDVDSFDGKNMRNASFEKKREILDLIAKSNPDYTLPDTAINKEEKEELLSSIVKKEHPQTKEGIVVHKKTTEKFPFIKAKVINHHDVYIKDIFKEEGVKEGRKPMAGGFTYSWEPDGKAVGKVGTGFSHSLKIDMLKNPNKYIGRAAKVKALDLSKNKVLVKPSFDGWHIEKNLKEAINNLNKYIEKVAKKQRPKVYAVDFDGTIAENKFPGIGKLKPATVEFIKRVHDRGDKVVIWTSRSGKHLERAEKFLKRNNIPYHEVNQNTTFSTKSPKIMADYYIDDKAVHVDDLHKIAGYKEGIEKIAVARWKKFINAAKNQEDLMNRYSEFNRNKKMLWRFSDYLGDNVANEIKPLNFSEKIKHIKRKISAFGKENAFAPEMSARVSELDNKWKNIRLNEVKKFGKRSAGKSPVDSDEWVNIVHGTNLAKAKAFLRGNSPSKTDTLMNVGKKHPTTKGIMVHTRTNSQDVKDRIKYYANRQSDTRGGDPVELSGRIQKKYLYHNNEYSGGGDEFSIPVDHFDKIKDAKITKLSYVSQIFKQAALKKNTKLYPHQQRIVDDPSTSKILAHPVGSGKTLTAVAKFEKMKKDNKAKKALVVVPAGLRDNFASHGIKKFTSSSYNIIGTKQESKKGGRYGLPKNDVDYNIISYEMFKRNPAYYIKATGADTVISDESHKSKNEDTAVTKALKKTRHLYSNYIGLTGSPISNTISDIQPLVDIASNKKHNLGKNKQEFEEKWLKRNNSNYYKQFHEKRRPVVGFKNKDELSKALSENVDYVDLEEIRNLAKIPAKNVNVQKVKLSKEQVKFYKGLLKNNPAIKKLITQKRLETLKDEEAAKAYSKLIEARKLMNSIGSVKPGIKLEQSAEMTPKTKKVLDDLQEYLNKNPQGRAILFSHLIKGGTDTLEAGLRNRKISYGRFLGKGNQGITEESRQKDVEDYNKGKKRVMVISSAGGEGLSLNDTSWEGVLDPHYNPEKMKQMEARGIRSGGLSYLPEKDRKVSVNRYVATMPKFLGLFKSKYKTPDEFIYEIAQNKEKQNDLLYKLLRENSKKKQKNNYAGSSIQ